MIFIDKDKVNVKGHPDLTYNSIYTLNTKQCRCKSRGLQKLVGHAEKISNTELQTLMGCIMGRNGPVLYQYCS